MLQKSVFILLWTFLSNLCFAQVLLNNFLDGKRGSLDFSLPQKLSSAKIRQSSPYSNSSYLCSAQAATFETTSCSTYEDCYNWLNYHGQPDRNMKLNPVFNNNNQSPESYINNVRCLNGKCSLLPQSGWNESCEWSTQDSCAVGLSCSSGTCQTPLAGGCGNCTDDVDSCLFLTMCSSNLNKCTIALTEGDRCVYNVSYRPVYYNNEGAQYIPFTVPIPRYYSCGYSVWNGQFTDDNLFCNLQTQKCEYPATLPTLGGLCTYQCPPGSFCQWNGNATNGNCFPYSTEGSYCDGDYNSIGHNRCEKGYYCDSSKCKELHSGGIGSQCALTEHCQWGLNCNNNICVAPFNVGDSCSTAPNNCVAGSFCKGNQCVEAYTQPLGQNCTMDFYSHCMYGLGCNGISCVKPNNTDCTYTDELCSSGTDYPFRGSCMCNNNGKTSCQYGQPVDTEALITATNCSRQTASTVPDLFATGNTFKSINGTSVLKNLCCVACNINNETALSNYYSSVLYTFGFALDEFQLSCNHQYYGFLLPKKTLSFCSMDQDYSLSGLQSLLQCSGAPVYTGFPKKPRFVASYNMSQYSSTSTSTATQTRYPVMTSGSASISHTSRPTATSSSHSPQPTATSPSCRTEVCHSRGDCTLTMPVACLCDKGYYGSSCQYTESKFEEQLSAITDLFQYTDGFNWHDNTNWAIPGLDVCQYFGVYCNAKGFVTELRLPYNNLRGLIPETISNLDSLQVVDFSGNFLIYRIPESLFTLSSLVHLDLSWNLLEGPLSPSIYYLEKLQYLALAGNRLSGPLPWGLGNIPSLTVLLLQRNNFTEGIPFSMGSLRNITAINIANNPINETDNLPLNMCHRCERFISKCNILGSDNCYSGQLLGCHSPNTMMTYSSCLTPQPLLSDDCIYNFSY